MARPSPGKETKMQTYTSEARALAAARLLTRAHERGDRKIYVVVAGPHDGEWTVMRLTEAIDGEFLYSW
jgi:hypothetical protein